MYLNYFTLFYTDANIRPEHYALDNVCIFVKVLGCFTFGKTMTCTLNLPATLHPLGYSCHMI